jgi:hypothetical protein
MPIDYITRLVVLYGCGTGSVMLMKEHKLREFEKMVLRRIFGPEEKLKKRVWGKTG